MHTAFYDSRVEKSCTEEVRYYKKCDYGLYYSDWVVKFFVQAPTAEEMNKLMITTTTTTTKGEKKGREGDTGKHLRKEEKYSRRWYEQCPCQCGWEKPLDGLALGHDDKWMAVMVALVNSGDGEASNRRVHHTHCTLIYLITSSEECVRWEEGCASSAKCSISSDLESTLAPLG